MNLVMIKIIFEVLLVPTGVPNTGELRYVG